MYASYLSPPKLLWFTLLSLPFLLCAGPRQAVAQSTQAQDQSAIMRQACGPRNAWFNVKLDRTRHPPAKPEPGEAVVYFVQDITKVLQRAGAITTRFGLDGGWVGAVKNNSYFSASVAPGEHHLCANLQAHALTKSADLAVGKMTELAHFTAEAGKIYYFRTRYVTAQFLTMEFGPVDRDQALYMIAADPRSISKPKK